MVPNRLLDILINQLSLMLPILMQLLSVIHPYLIKVHQHLVERLLELLPNMPTDKWLFQLWLHFLQINFIRFHRKILIETSHTFSYVDVILIVFLDLSNEFSHLWEKHFSYHFDGLNFFKKFHSVPYIITFPYSLVIGVDVLTISLQSWNVLSLSFVFLKDSYNFRIYLVMRSVHFLSELLVFYIVQFKLYSVLFHFLD